MKDKTIHPAICPKCEKGKKGFYAKQIETIDYAEKLIAICCGNCGAVITFLPLREMRKKWKDFSERLNVIEKKLESIKS